MYSAKDMLKNILVALHQVRSNYAVLTKHEVCQDFLALFKLNLVDVPSLELGRIGNFRSQLRPNRTSVKYSVHGSYYITSYSVQTTSNNICHLTADSMSR
jgi:hypothetical protein